MHIVLGISFFCTVISFLHGMNDSDISGNVVLKKVYDHHRKEFVNPGARSLVDICVQAYAPQLISQCNELSGDNIEELGSHLVMNMPENLHPLIIQHLFLHAAGNQWKIRFRNKIKKEKEKSQGEPEILYADEDIEILQKSFYNNRRLDHAQVSFFNKAKIEKIAHALMSNGNMRGIFACLYPKCDEAQYRVHVKDLVSNNTKVSNSTKVTRVLDSKSLQKICRSPSGNLLLGLSTFSRCCIVFDALNFDEVQTLDTNQRNSSYFHCIEDEGNLFLMNFNFHNGGYAMWQYDAKQKKFVSRESGIQERFGYRTNRIDVIQDNEIQENILVQSSFDEGLGSLTFYRHVPDNRTNPFWTPVQRIDTIKDYVFSDDKKTCIALELDLKTAKVYQRIDGTWQMVSTIVFEKEINCLINATDGFLCARRRGKDYYVDINTGKAIARFSEREGKKPVLNVPYALVLASIARSNDYNKQDQKSLKKLLVSNTLNSEQQHDPYNDYTMQLRAKTEKAITRSSVALRFSKFIHQGSFWGLGLLGWGMNSLILYRILSNSMPSDESSPFMTAVVGSGIATAVSAYSLSTIVGIDSIDRFTRADQNWLYKK